MAGECQELNKILQSFEEASEPFDAAALSDAIVKLRHEAGSDNQRPMECRAESAAFLFCEEYGDQPSGWGTYYGPFYSRVGDDGKWLGAPDIADVTPEILQYWAERAQTVRNPAMRNRYADLVWDFSRRVNGKQCDVRFARIVIDSAVELFDSGRFERVGQVQAILRRGLKLAISIKDYARLNSIRNVILQFEARNGREDGAESWTFAFDSLVSNPGAALSTGQLSIIIAGLEAQLNRACGLDGSLHSDPNSALSLAQRLARFYKQRNREGDARRVLRLCRRATELWSAKASPLLSSAWYKQLYDVYQRAGMPEDTDALATTLKTLGEQSVTEMATTTFEDSIPREEVERYVEFMTSGSLVDVLNRIAGRFLVDSQHVARQVDEMAKTSVFMAVAAQTVVDRKGRQIAEIPPVQQDPAGHVVNHMSKTIAVEAPFLRLVLDAAIRKFEVSVGKLVDHLYQSPVFDEDNRPLFEVGLSALLKEEHVIAIHVLVPQIEATLRRLLELTDRPIYRPGRHGGLNLRNLDDILGDDVVIAVLSVRVADYLRAIWTDVRGWNLRNEICHGLVAPEMLSWQVADRVLHTLLVLATVRCKATKPEARDESSSPSPPDVSG